MGNLDFNAETDTPAGDPFELIPDGLILEMVVSKSERKESKATPGSFYLKLEFAVIETGKHEGKRVFGNLNLWHAKEEVQSIARRELGSLCRAIGKLDLADHEDLQGIPFKAKIGIETGKNGFEDKNKIKKFLEKEGFGEVKASEVKKSSLWAKK